MMKIRIPFLMGLVLLIFGNLSCSANRETAQDLPEGVPFGNYTDAVVQLYIPEYYDVKTGCYYSPKPGTKLKNDSDFTVVNTFAGGEGAKIGFLLILKPNTGYIFGGKDSLLLFHYDEETEKWEEVSYTIDESTPIWKNGDVLAEGRYLNIGKEKCHFFPESPIYLYPQNENGMINGIYRLYTWGAELDKNTMVPYAFPGDFVEFTLGQGE